MLMYCLLEPGGVGQVMEVCALCVWNLMGESLVCVKIDKGTLLDKLGNP
jgi:hypothetical protein